MRAAYYGRLRESFETRDLARYHALIAQIRRRYAGVPVGASESIFALQAPALGLALTTPYGFMKAISEGTEVELTIDQGEFLAVLGPPERSSHPRRCWRGCDEERASGCAGPGRARRAPANAQPRARRTHRMGVAVRPAAGALGYREGLLPLATRRTSSQSIGVMEGAGTRTRCGESPSFSPSSPVSKTAHRHAARVCNETSDLRKRLVEELLATPAGIELAIDNRIGRSTAG